MSIIAFKDKSRRYPVELQEFSKALVESWSSDGSIIPAYSEEEQLVYELGWNAQESILIIISSLSPAQFRKEVERRAYALIEKAIDEKLKAEANLQKAHMKALEMREAALYVSV